MSVFVDSICTFGVEAFVVSKGSRKKIGESLHSGVVLRSVALEVLCESSGV